MELTPRDKPCCIVRIFIDREAREIMYLVASVRPSVCQFVSLSELSCLNRLTFIARMRSIGF